jgi:FlaG/FlaF family flagellin (archaellin)
MSLRAFHLLFIAISVILTAFFAAWAAGQYQVAHQPGYVMTAAASLGSGVALAVYFVLFQRKTRRLS